MRLFFLRTEPAIRFTTPGGSGGWPQQLGTLAPFARISQPARSTEGIIPMKYAKELEDHDLPDFVFAADDQCSSVTLSFARKIIDRFRNIQENGTGESTVSLILQDFFSEVLLPGTDSPGIPEIGYVDVRDRALDQSVYHSLLGGKIDSALCWKAEFATTTGQILIHARNSAKQSPNAFRDAMELAGVVVLGIEIKRAGGKVYEAEMQLARWAARTHAIYHKLGILEEDGAPFTIPALAIIGAEFSVYYFTNEDLPPISDSQDFGIPQQQQRFRMIGPLHIGSFHSLEGVFAVAKAIKTLKHWSDRALWPAFKRAMRTSNEQKGVGEAPSNTATNLSSPTLGAESDVPDAGLAD